MGEFTTWPVKEWRLDSKLIWKPVSKSKAFWKKAPKRSWTLVYKLSLFWEPAYRTFGQLFPNWTFFWKPTWKIFFGRRLTNCCNLETGIYEMLHNGSRILMKSKICTHTKMSRFPNELSRRNRPPHKIGCQFPNEYWPGNRRRHKRGQGFPVHVRFGNRLPPKYRWIFPFHSSASEVWLFGMNHGDGCWGLGCQKGAFWLFN